ncbi:MAG: restriction endonuclease subunit S [Rhizobiaceae bacterium]|nr:restriction endonuclease subunit S [Rhizobiaceae bacterium]MCV0404866.1 restriction endonuclease subunit S [Rhizobiaceae bacterium]
MTLPEGWAAATIGDLCDLINGKAFKPSDWSRDGLPIIRIQNLNRRESEFNFFDRDVDEKFIVENGELLFAWSGTPGTSFGAHVWHGPRAVLNQHIFRVRFEEKAVDRDFFLHAINSTLDELIGKAHGGVGLAHVTRGKFEATRVPLPPLPEQSRIVAKLETLIARIARAKAELDRVPVLTNQLRETTLQAAFYGPEPATEDPRIHRRAKPLHGLPAGWEWRALGSIGNVTGGLTKNAKRRLLPLRAKYLRVANVYANELRLTDVEEIGCTERELAKTALQNGDLLIVEGNGSLQQVGRAAIWRAEIADCSHQNHLIRFRAGDDILPEIVLFWLMSPVGRQILERFAASTSGLHTLSISKVSGLPIPQGPIEVQQAVVRKIQMAFDRADRLEAEAGRARKLLDRLESAILAKAFRGELVPQDPNDEPASVLLERIRAAGAAAPKARRGRRAST